YQRKQEMAHQILYGLTAFFLVVPAVFGPQERGVARRLLRSRVLTSIGIVSYGVFLWHYDWIKQLVDFGLLRHVHALRFPVLLAAAAWLFLASTVASRLRAPAARAFGFVSLLLLALSPPVLLWNSFIATESLSISLLCIVIALGIRLAGGHEGRHDFTAFVVVLVPLPPTRATY